MPSTKAANARIGKSSVTRVILSSFFWLRPDIFVPKTLSLMIASRTDFGYMSGGGGKDDRSFAAAASLVGPAVPSGAGRKGISSSLLYTTVLMIE